MDYSMGIAALGMMPTSPLILRGMAGLATAARHDMRPEVRRAARRALYRARRALRAARALYRTLRAGGFAPDPASVSFDSLNLYTARTRAGAAVQFILGAPEWRAAEEFLARAPRSSYGAPAEWDEVRRRMALVRTALSAMVFAEAGVKYER
jgi:hypothetical protein